ncbi:unnamed protein product, partial [Ixodes pacificus]
DALIGSRVLLPPQFATFCLFCFYGLGPLFLLGCFLFPSIPGVASRRHFFYSADICVVFFSFVFCCSYFYFLFLWQQQWPAAALFFWSVFVPSRRLRSCRSCCGEPSVGSGPIFSGSSQSFCLFQKLCRREGRSAEGRNKKSKPTNQRPEATNAVGVLHLFLFPCPSLTCSRPCSHQERIPDHWFLSTKSYGDRAVLVVLSGRVQNVPRRIRLTERRKRKMTRDRPSPLWIPTNG